MGSITENAAEVIATIKKFFDDMGGSCSELLSSSLGMYKKMLLSAVDILSKDYQGTVGTNSYTHATEHYGEFKDFWTVITNVSNIFAAIATTLITLLFLISMVNDSWDNRHQMDFADLFKSFAKFFAAVVLVNNSTKIVSALFTMSARVAALICSTNNLSDLDVSLKAADENLIRYGVSGPKGLIISILFLMVFLVIIASGITIMLEVYQRMFKIFVLIPFSAISFSTFTMSDNHRGAEVFHGYVKSIVSTAIESIVIMVFIAFSLVLINGDGLGNLFDSEGNVLYEQYSVSSISDLYYLKYCKSAKMFSDDQVGVINQAEINENDEYSKVSSDNVKKLAKGVGLKAVSATNGSGILAFALDVVGTGMAVDAANDQAEQTSYIRSSESRRNYLKSDGSVSTTLLNQLSSHHSSQVDTINSIRSESESGSDITIDSIKQMFKDKGIVYDKFVSSVVINGMDIDEINIEEVSVSEESPATVYVYGEISFFDILLCVFKYIFPCLLCGTSVKMAGQISGMILGR